MGKKIIEIDPSAGFCFGVENAINIAEKQLSDHSNVFGLGHMVHNDAEIGRLDELGLKTISSIDSSELKPGKVVIRAHGEPPETFDYARANNIQIIDATCPIVTKLQKKISRQYQILDKENQQIIIFGKIGHPETIGLMGQTKGEAVLITDPDDISAIDPEKSVFLYSQTTMDPEDFQLLEDNIRKSLGNNENVRFEANYTICGQMKKRKPDLKKFANQYDTILFVSGRESSNGAMLFNYCKKQNKNTHWIHSVNDINPAWIKEEGSIGISGATSTPGWQLRRVKECLESFIDDHNC
ncbi:4-hydroxy-3-methylbut-2-enyl diphosphate reductase [Bacteroidota bacterium]